MGGWSGLRVLLLLILSVSLTSILFVRGDNPSPVGWNLSGGGFCQGTYTIFNTTLSPNPGVYAQNCQTGTNLFNATDTGFLVNSALKLMTFGGVIHFRAQQFSIVTTITILGNIPGTLGTGNTAYGVNLIIEGSGSGGTAFNRGSGVNGTLLVAKTVGMTMMQTSTSSSSVTCTPASGCTGAPSMSGFQLRDLGFDGNCKAAIGFDGRMHETAILNRYTNLSFGSGCGTTTFTTALILDGEEDTYVDRLAFDGAGTLGTGGAATDLQWQSLLGNVNVLNSFFGGQVNLLLSAQNVEIQASTLGSIKILQTAAATTGTVIHLSGNYLANIIGAGIIQLNGNTASVIRFDGNAIRTTSTIPLYAGAGTVQNAGFSGNTWAFGASSNWNAGGATLTKQVTAGDNHVVTGSAPTNFPFTIDGNGNF